MADNPKGGDGADKPRPKPRAKRRGRVGNLPPRYSFMLNPFPETRLSRCPRCDGLTFPRKFPLFIHVQGWGPYTQGKSCKYCPRDEIIMCHQDELEFEMAASFEKLAPELIGNDYFVLGTAQVNAWKAGMRKPLPFDEPMDHTAEFKKHLSLQFDPGGWRHKDAGPRYLEPRPLDTRWQLARRARDAAGKGGTGRSSPGGRPPGPGAASPA